jgi:branched-chain amino acid transport system permease protein
MRFWLVRLGSIALGFAACFLIDVISRMVLGQYEQRLVVLIGLYVTLAVSLNLINGITGQFSIGHAAFYMIGAYLSGFISVRYITEAGNQVSALPWLIAMVAVGAFSAAIAGFVVGLPSLRLRGDYLAIVTLGFGEIIRIVVQNTEELGGAYALDRIPRIQPIWLTWGVAFMCIAVCRNLIKTSRGLTFLAVREDEVASSAMGVGVTRVKVTAFVIGSAFAGAAGALLAHYEGLITPQTFSMDVSFIILTMVVLGGTGSITGSVVAAIFLAYLPEFLRGLRAADGTPLTVSGAGVVAALFAVVFVVYMIKRMMDGHWGTRSKRGLAYVGLIVLGIALTPLFTLAFGLLPQLRAMQVEAGNLRMVIFATTLIVLMLLRPQGIFAHHEFSWDFVRRLFGKKHKDTEVAA